MARELDKSLYEGKQMTATVTSAQAAATGAGAPSLFDSLWLQADWDRIKNEVQRLQARIAKATMDGSWNKVKVLQRLLTRSHSGKMLAVKRVTENRGKRTPGVDGRIWSTPAAKWKGMEAMQHRSYRAMPLRRIYIPKSNGKKRPLGIPRMLCRAMQAVWKLALEPVSETLADPNSYGFRPKRSTADAIAYCFNTLAKRSSPTWVLEGDIRGCFDNFSHDWILEHVPMDKAILRQWLQAGFVDEGTLFATDAGTPQGGIISPVIANMTLDGLEAAVYASVGPTKRARGQFNINVVRYADDFVVTAISKEILENNVLPAVKKFMAVRGLELSEEKTKITHIAEGFDFLGQNIRKYDGKLLIKPALKSVKAILTKVRGIVWANKSATQANLIQQLDPVIRGWAMYHRHVVSKARFSSIDDDIWHLLWKWAMRRHPTKSAKWVRQKYFHAEESRHGIFAAESKVNGGFQRLRLFRASTIPIVRHVKIRGAANPFDPAWESYFTERQAKKDSD
jgi:RNA-directed DNA polymerase